MIPFPQAELVDGDVEKEFLTLMAKLKKTHLGQHLVYQINNYVEVSEPETAHLKPQVGFNFHELLNGRCL
jgi:hypothetical protein